MKCKKCNTNNAPVKKTCSNCGAFLEGYTLNNVTGKYGYRNADGSFTNHKDPNVITVHGLPPSISVKNAKITGK